MEHDKIDLKSLFVDFQQQMSADLNITRKHVPHPGTKGDGSEKAWIQWMKRYLPKRYEVDKAQIVDCNGSLSQQIDVVIYDRQYSPFVFNHAENHYIPAESVYAVFECKQEINKETLEYASAKIASVRSLKRTCGTIYQAGGDIYKPKPPFQILGGILTTQSGWNPPLGDAFEELIKNFEDDGAVDIGCSIMDGSFMVTKKEGVTAISRSATDEILLFFFLNLFMALQRRATVPAIDVLEYAKVLKSL